MVKDVDFLKKSVLKKKGPKMFPLQQNTKNRALIDSWVFCVHQDTTLKEKVTN